MGLIENICASARKEEGFKSKMYKDHLGVNTIGYGFNLDEGISKALAEKILQWIVQERIDLVMKAYPFVANLTENRQAVYIEMAYQMGMPRFSKFTDMHAAAAAGDIRGVAREMKDSLWYRQVPNRAERMIKKYVEG